MKTSKYKILIADPDKAFLDKLNNFLMQDDRIEVVGTADSPRNIYAELKRLQPDALLFEPAMPKYDCYKLIRELCVLFDKVMTVALSAYNFPKLVNNSIELGLQGFLWKDTDLPLIYNAINSIKNGNKYLSESTQTGLNKAVFSEVDDFLRGISLSFRERDILTLLTRGYDNNRIARKFNTDGDIINKDIHQVMEKLKLNSVEQVKFFAVQQGLY